MSKGDLFDVTPIKTRLSMFLEYKGLTKSGFEKTCGLYNGFVKDLDQKITFESLSKIAAAFPCLNLGWLFSGAGSMLINEASSEKGQREASSQEMRQATNDVHHNQQVVIANWEDLRGVLEEVIQEQLRNNKV